MHVLRTEVQSTCCGQGLSPSLRMAGDCCQCMQSRVYETAKRPSFRPSVCPSVCLSHHSAAARIGVNAAGVAVVATPQYLTCRGCPVLTTPVQYFDKCFIFSPSAELLNTASRCHFHLQCALCTVFNSTVEHMNLKKRHTHNAPYHTILR